MTLINKIFPASLHSVFLCFLITIFVLLSGCQTILPTIFWISITCSQNETPLQHLAQSPRMPLATHEFTFDATRDDVVGRLQLFKPRKRYAF
jgi:L,D-transpeptidase ErfK/SrfK